MHLAWTAEVASVVAGNPVNKVVFIFIERNKSITASYVDNTERSFG